MAGDAIGCVAMGIGMAKVTGEGRMLAGVVDHLFFGSGMTGDAHLLVLANDGDIQRLVGVVTAETRICDLVVGAIRMAITALGNVAL